jgi:hypothetical protein
MIKYFLTLFVVLTLTTNSHACDPDPRPDPWFIYTVKIDKHSLPKGVELISEPFSFTERQWIQSRFFLINKNKTPLYIYKPLEKWKLRPVYKDKYSYPDSELPLGYEPKYKLQNSEAYYYATTNYRNPKGYESLCSNCSGTNKLIEFNQIFPKINNMIIHKDGRPDDIKAPEPMNFSINAIYGKENKNLAGSISFKLNEHYDPQMGEKTLQEGIQACSEFEALNSNNNL